MILRNALLATLFLAAGPALAQGAAPKPDVPSPHADPGIVARPKPGLVQPRQTDPGMAVPAPQTGRGTVIPPPGTARNNPALVPK